MKKRHLYKRYNVY